MDNKAQSACWASIIQEILIQIFSNLDFASLVSVSRVCRSWRCVAHFQECWDRIYFAHNEIFLENNIKESLVPDHQARLCRESVYVIRYAGFGAKSIFVSPLADDMMLQMIADRCPSIESISLRGCERISETAFLKLIRTCKDLKLVDLKLWLAVSASTIEEMGRSCPSLVGLNLGGQQVTTAMAIAIGKFMPKLKWLNLNNAIISSNILCSILDSCTELEYVSALWSHGLFMYDELRSRANRIAEFKHSHHDPTDPQVVEFYYGADLWYP
ncbi:uncharacterized protein LOC131240585 [Magnolia sinica]|uniref:uncharacterized protein LOC131240585 n=1 Tax=Magnolia sinica TaxID=86752 RepID=UPI00265B387C|nr:uncharacterized protein LOC131240585 [Magnolia sinica]